MLALSAVVASVAVLGLPALQADTPQMPISEIRPGMVGIGRTVFSGTQVEEFQAHILGVIENVIGTQRNLILARLEGGPLATTGVIAGMSGSPVYIDGKLIGAVSYCTGQLPQGADRRHHAHRGDDGCDLRHVHTSARLTREGRVPAVA